VAKRNYDDLNIFLTSYIKKTMPKKSTTTTTPWVKALKKYHKEHPRSPLIPKKGTSQYIACKKECKKHK
jgi:hypothetical protein